MIPTKHDAIRALCPNSTFSILDGTIIWHSMGGDSVPSDSAITTKWDELKTKYTDKKYQRDRSTSYPSIQDQLDMQYWDKKNGTTTWVDAVAKVKADNPKP